jgi:hypothetical protein
MLSRSLGIAKRQVRSFSSPLSSAGLEEGLSDNQKELTDESDYVSSPKTSSSLSSRVTSQSYDLMLHHSRSPSPSRSRKARAYSDYRSRTWNLRGCGLCRCSPRMGNRYFTLVLFTTLIVFILTLSRQSWSSRREVALGLKRPPPPPPVW